MKNLFSSWNQAHFLSLDSHRQSDLPQDCGTDWDHGTNDNSLEVNDSHPPMPHCYVSEKPSRPRAPSTSKKSKTLAQPKKPPDVQINQDKQGHEHLYLIENNIIHWDLSSQQTQRSVADLKHKKAVKEFGVLVSKNIMVELKKNPKGKYFFRLPCLPPFRCSRS